MSTTQLEDIVKRLTVQELGTSLSLCSNYLRSSARTLVPYTTRPVIAKFAVNGR